MFQHLRTIFTYVGAIGLLVVILFIVADAYTYSQDKGSENASGAKAAQPFSNATFGTSSMATSVLGPAQQLEKVEISTSSIVSTPPESVKESQKNESGITQRSEPPSQEESALDAIDARVRSTLVNIQCFAGSHGVRSITASGVLIDSRGIILTNAHVAQYVLLSQSSEINLKCYAEYGSPAQPLWNLRVLYISPTWVKKHAGDIKKERSVGTGEFDYGLLYVTNSTAGVPQTTVLPSLEADTRNIPALPGDTVFVASYPAEFAQSEEDLNALISITSIRELLTFDDGTVDIISVGGVPGAQSGSSGGALVDLAGHLLGIITTTSDEAVIAERDLRAISLHYVDKALKKESGLDLRTVLSADLASLAESFNANMAPALIDLLVTEIKKL